jgi:hypothetical protein
MGPHKTRRNEIETVMETTRPAHLRPRPGIRPAPRSRPRPWLWILLLVPVGLFASVAAIVGLGALFNLTGTNVALAAGERELVVDISHLTGWMNGYTPDPSGETLQKTRYIDDSFEIEYVYDLPEDDEAPYLSHSVTFEPSESDASTTYVSLWGGTKVAFYVFGEVQVEVKEKNELFSWGDESRFGLLLADGQPFGNVFVARKGKRVVYLLVSGIYFDEAESFSGFLSPYLEKLEVFAVEG